MRDQGGATHLFTKIHSSQLKMSLILSFVVFDVDGLVIFIEF